MHSLLSKKSDQELWKLLRIGSKVSFQTLYQRHIESLYNFGLKITANQELVKDTLQELFTEIWKKKDSLSEVTHVKVYLIKSLRYKLLRAGSNTSKQRTYSFEELFIDIPDIGMVDSEQNIERIKQLKEAINLLPHRQKEVIHLRYFQNLKNEEIADIINVNYQSVSNLLHRALTKLKGVMKNDSNKLAR